MSDNTDIDRDRYIQATWNPIAGCTHVSEGCRNCYAEHIASRFSDPGMWGYGFAERTSKGGRWTGRVELLPHKLDIPLRHTRPRSYFVGSTSDLFHRDLSDDDIDQVLTRAQVADRHRYLILTKRPERMREYFTSLAAAEDWPGLNGRIVRMGEDSHIVLRWPLPNVWLGVSVEDQATADARIPHLLATPAAVRFVSAEPLLGPIDMRDLTVTTQSGYEQWDVLDRAEAADAEPGYPTAVLDWVIVGGESGPGARPMHPDWVRSIRDQCVAAKVPFFFKQWGDYTHSSQISYQKKSSDQNIDDGNGGRWCRVGNNRSGYNLDGKMWRQWPQ